MQGRKTDTYLQPGIQRVQACTR